MNILENLKGRDATPKTYAPAAPPIRKKLDAVQARLGPLQAQLSDLALDAELGVPSADAKLATVQQQIAELKATASQLTLALKAALERDRAEIVRQRASIHKSQMNALKRHLSARDAAAEGMSKALKEAAEQYKIILDHSEKAERANPVGCGPWPAGTLTSLAAIKPLVAAELYKLMPGTVMTSSPFPGAVCAFDHQGQPDKIMPLADALRADSSYIMEKLTGKSAD